VAGSDVSKADSHWADIVAGAEARMAENSKALADALAENDNIRRTHQEELDKVRKEITQCGIRHLHEDIPNFRSKLQTKLFAPQKMDIEEVKLRGATVEAQASISSMKKNVPTERFRHYLRPRIRNNNGLVTSARMQRPRPQFVRRGHSIRQLLIEDDASISDVSVDTCGHSMKGETFKQPSKWFKDPSAPQNPSDPYDSSSEDSCLTPRELSKRLTSPETTTPGSTSRRSHAPCDHVDLDRLVTMLMHERGENDAICVDLRRFSKSLQEASPVASTTTASGCTALSFGCRSPDRASTSDDDVHGTYSSISLLRTPRCHPPSSIGKGFGLTVEVMKVTLIKDHTVLNRHPFVALHLGNGRRDSGVLRAVKHTPGEYRAPDSAAVLCWSGSCMGRSLMVQVFSKERRLTEPKMKPLGMGTLDLHELETTEMVVYRASVPLEGPGVEPGAELVIRLWKQGPAEFAGQGQ